MTRSKFLNEENVLSVSIKSQLHLKENYLNFDCLVFFSANGIFFFTTSFLNIPGNLTEIISEQSTMKSSNTHR